MRQTRGKTTGPGQRRGPPPDWEGLKTKILAAIKKDGEPEEFKALFDDVSNFMTEIKLTG